MLLNATFSVAVNAPSWDTTQDHTTVVTVPRARDITTAALMAASKVTGRRLSIRRTASDTFLTEDRDALVATVRFLSAF